MYISDKNRGMGIYTYIYYINNQVRCSRTATNRNMSSHSINVDIAASLQARVTTYIPNLPPRL